MSTDLSLSNVHTIPRNYYCSWSLDLDKSQKYYVNIERFTTPKEELTLVAGDSSSNQASTYRDDQLAGGDAATQYYII
jgi:hypothetical protein